MSELWPPEPFVLENYVRPGTLPVNAVGSRCPLDLYTLAYACWGSLMRASGVPFSAAVARSLGLEWWIEPELKWRRPEVLSWLSPDSSDNLFFDTAAVGAG